MSPRCRFAWALWGALTASSFAYLEARAYRHHCHQTLSRELQRLTGVRPRRPWGRGAPLVFAATGGWLTYHVITLKDLPSP